MRLVHALADAVLCTSCLAPAWAAHPVAHRLLHVSPGIAMDGVAGKLANEPQEQAGQTFVFVMRADTPPKSATEPTAAAKGASSKLVVAGVVCRSSLTRSGWFA